MSNGHNTAKNEPVHQEDLVEESDIRLDESGQEKKFPYRTRRSSRGKSGGRYRLDNLERAIIRELTEDGRRPFQAIARELGVDEKTVRNRVGKLREMGALKIIPTAEVNQLKGCIVAVIAANISSDGRKHVEQVAQDISDLPMVSWVGILLGQFDLLIEVVVDNWEALTEFEYAVLPSVSGIATTASFLVLSHYGKRGVPFVETIVGPKEQ